MIEAGKTSLPNETGGVLIGYYTRSRRTAVVESATLPSPDSEASRTRFYRGVVGLQRLLARFWRRPPEERRYYLGEWHVHPGGASVPSQHDHAQMLEIARSENYQCPEAILVLLGGDLTSGGSLAIWIFRREEAPIRLRQENLTPTGE
ncbi:MAG: Mov34/MPN/PAD-1 family protein [Thermoanaerobaculia bacterium]